MVLGSSTIVDLEKHNIATVEKGTLVSMPLKPEPESYCNGSGLNALSRNFKQTCTLISKLHLSDIKNYYYLLVLF